jgi:hypothetical protein
MHPMIEQVETRCGRSLHDSMLDDGDLARDQLDGASPHARAYAIVPKPDDPAIDPHVTEDGDSDAVGAWPCC